MWRDLVEKAADTTAADTTFEDLVKDELANAPTKATPQAAKPQAATPQPAKPPPADIAAVKKETVVKESQVRSALEEQQKKLRDEAARLAIIDSELKKLSAKEQADISILRTELEGIDRQLVWLERDFKHKEAAFKKAKDAFEGLDQRKRSLHEHLALMVLSSEKRKEAKLNELLAQMRS